MPGNGAYCAALGGSILAGRLCNNPIFAQIESDDADDVCDSGVPGVHCRRRVRVVRIMDDLPAEFGITIHRSGIHTGPRRRQVWITLGDSQSHGQRGGECYCYGSPQSHGQTGGKCYCYDFAQSHGQTGGICYCQTPQNPTDRMTGNAATAIRFNDDRHNDITLKGWTRPWPKLPFSESTTSRLR